MSQTRFIERNAKIATLVQTHTLQEIGEEFNVSRERVRQILKRAKVEYRFGQGHKKVKDIDTDKLIECPICKRQLFLDKSSNSTAQRKLARSKGILSFREHCRKYKHPDPFRANWKHTQKIVQAYKRGMKAIDIRKKFNLPHQEVLYIYLRQWHVKPRYEQGAIYATWVEQPIGRNIERQREVAEWAHMLPAEIVAKQFGISPTRVAQIKQKFPQNEKSS